MVQALLDLLCSQLKNLLSRAGVSLLPGDGDHEEKKSEESSDPEKKDFRGSRFLADASSISGIEIVLPSSVVCGDWLQGFGQLIVCLSKCM